MNILIRVYQTVLRFCRKINVKITVHSYAFKKKFATKCPHLLVRNAVIGVIVAMHSVFNDDNIFTALTGIRTKKKLPYMGLNPCMSTASYSAAPSVTCLYDISCIFKSENFLENFFVEILFCGF